VADRRIRPARGIPAEWVEMEHDGIEGTHRCSPRAVKHWEARGWSVVKPKTDAADSGTRKAPAAAQRSAGGSEG
jgi:hypothetical protein